MVSSAGAIGARLRVTHHACRACAEIPQPSFTFSWGSMCRCYLATQENAEVPQVLAGDGAGQAGRRALARGGSHGVSDTTIHGVGDAHKQANTLVLGRFQRG